MQEAEVMVPAIETLVQVEGTLDRPVCHIRFEKITFSYTTWMRPSEKGHVPLQAGMYLTDGYRIDPKMQRDYLNHLLDNQGWLGRPAAAVRIAAARQIDFERCRFEHLGSTGLDYEEAVQGGIVRGCLFRDIAGNGLLAGSFSPAAHETHLPYDPADRREVPMRELDLAPFWRSLPYAPTGAQRRSAEEICHDLCGQTPMNRLLQGDVGSGKTLVAAAAIWFAAQNGWQSAMLAPTEILARQHAANLADRLEPFGVNVTLLVGGMKAAEKRVALAAIADGRAGLVVGTHAVLTDSVVFKNLGLAIVDEQHRFGVRQRGVLAGKANNPHLLVMSATPIPRTLGLLMYGDLDISILDELPPGRKPIKTWFITGKKRRDMYGFLEKQIAAGHQVYIVCPAIEENEMDSGMKAVKQYYEQVACPLLPGRRIGLLHGKMKPKDKDEVMQQFKAGELDVLVSTTVIEVGVDVPNATVMVIENAERFGLSALHQLRGRVGRGAANSCCILISDNEGEAVRQRLHFLCRTSDGFAVAKYDLETRGPGDFFGEAQHGLPTLHVADLVQDTRTLTVAQQEAKALLALDPNLAKPEHKALSDEVERLFATAGAMN